MFKCPYCGHDLSKPVDYNSLILKELELYPKDIQKLIKEVSRKITTTIPSETSKQLHWMLYSIKDISEYAIKFGIVQFLDHEYHLHGKGFGYLKAIINNAYVNYNKFKELERKRLGTIPPYSKD